MKNKLLSLLFLISFLCIDTNLFSQYYSNSYLRLTSPQGWSYSQGYLDDVNIEITPELTRARVAISFYINIDNNTYGYIDEKDSLESFMGFTLDKESYFFDSYLWLDNTTIIRAELMDRSTASRIYDSIVNRRIDPSILVKNSETNYSLQVFPVTTKFKRKVEICYSTPIDKDNTLDILAPFKEIIKKDEIIKITVNNSYYNKFFNCINIADSKTTINSTSTLIEFNINKYKSDSKLSFRNIQNKQHYFAYQPINENEGFYMFQFNTSILDNLKGNTIKYKIQVPFGEDGFTFNESSNNNNLLKENESYSEYGMYFGELNISKPILVNYFIENKWHSNELYIENKVTANNIGQDWTYYYNKYYESDESFAYCLQHRVLTTKSAFLSLENGDTVGSTKGNDVTYNTNVDNGNSSIYSSNSTTVNAIKVSPNPFVDKINIKSKSKINSLKLYDIKGELLYNIDILQFTKEAIINTSELNLVSGQYILLVETDYGVESFKLMME